MSKWWRTHSLRYDGKLGFYYDFYQKKRFPLYRKVGIIILLAILLTIAAYREYLK